jgi:hypothetical protein
MNEEGGPRREGHSPILKQEKPEVQGEGSFDKRSPGEMFACRSIGAKGALERSGFETVERCAILALGVSGCSILRASGELFRGNFVAPFEQALKTAARVSTDQESAEPAER